MIVQEFKINFKLFSKKSHYKFTLQRKYYFMMLS